MENKHDSLAEGAGGGGLCADRSLLRRLSTALAKAELFAAGLLTFALFALLLTNVVSRFLGAPLLWADELAVFLMVMAAFLAASAAVSARQHIAVTLLADKLGPQGSAILALIVDLILLAFLLLLVWMVWIWFDPLTLLAAGSAEAFSATSFNFIYQEPTVTLGIRKVWFWLIMPVFALCATFHCLSWIDVDLRSLKRNAT